MTDTSKKAIERLCIQSRHLGMDHDRRVDITLCALLTERDALTAENRSLAMDLLVAHGQAADAHAAQLAAEAERDELRAKYWAEKGVNGLVQKALEARK